jgi:hypothetical protein
LRTAGAELVLSNGWNLISLPVEPTNAAIKTVLAPIQGDYEAVWSHISGRWYGFNPNIPGLSDLKHMYAGRAYWIQMRRDAVLPVYGTAPANAPDALGGQKLTAGWNLLGYSSSLSEDVTNAFAAIAGNLDLAATESSSGRLWYVPGNPAASTFSTLAPYRGVWAHVNTSVNWLAPNYPGTLVDALSGDPVVGAIVALDGIEAEAPTDAHGNFMVYGVSDAAAQLFTAVAPGYASFATTIDLSGGTLQPANLFMTPLGKPFVVDVLTPQNNSVWMQPNACQHPALTVKGYTALQDQTNFLYDIVFVIDTSASTARRTGFDLNGDGVEDTVFEAEVEACRRMVNTLTDREHVRFGLVKFARNHTQNASNGSVSDGPLMTNETRLVQSITRDPASIQSGLDVVVSEGATGATDIAAGIDLAVEELTNAVPSGFNYLVTPVRHIVLLTDGIPTLPIESGNTQERGDRVATLEAAQRAIAAQISIHPVVLDSTNGADRKLTTMPSVQAITGVPGDLIRINADNISLLPDLLASMALTYVPAVSLLDHTSGNSWNISVQPNGWFEALLPVSLGTNDWEFRFASGKLDDDQIITRSVSFVVYPATNTPPDVVSLTAANPPVSDLASLDGPTGVKLHDSGPELSLLSVLTDKVPAARTLPGVESFRNLSGTMTFEFIFKGSTYDSDVGYFLFDPNNPPKTAAQALAGLTETNLFLNSSVVPSNSLSVTGLVSTLQVPPGLAVGLFMVPNGHLAEAQAPPHAQCTYFPIALSQASLSNAVPGTILSNIWNGAQPGNFGWLSWTGDQGDPALATSLTLPGNSSTYVSPDNASDHELVVGDWVFGRTGVNNSANVRDALDALKNVTIVVPVWDQVHGKGSKATYHIVAFANVQIISYQLPSQNIITARFLGFTDCGKRVNPPLFTLASLNPGQFDQAVTFYDPAGGQIVCAFEDVDIMSSHSDLDFQDLVFTVKPIDPLPQNTECSNP